MRDDSLRRYSTANSIFLKHLGLLSSIRFISFWLAHPIWSAPQEHMNYYIHKEAVDSVSCYLIRWGALQWTQWNINKSVSLKITWRTFEILFLKGSQQSPLPRRSVFNSPNLETGGMLHLTGFHLMHCWRDSRKEFFASDDWRKVLLICFVYLLLELILPKVIQFVFLTYFFHQGVREQCL